MNDFMTPFDRGKNLVPFPFDICSVGMQHRLQPSFGQDLLTGRHVRGQGYAHADWDNAQIEYHVHVVNYTTRISSVSSGYFAALAMK